MDASITTRDVLVRIEELGWSDIIDRRWRNKLVGDIYDEVPDISVNVVNDVLNLVLTKE